MKTEGAEYRALHEHACTRCKARRHYECVYTTGPAVGMPTQRVHNERREAVYRAARRERLAAELEVAKATRPPWVDALHQFDLDEREAMREWLRANALRLFRFPA